MSIHPFGLIAQNAVYPTEYTGAAGTGPIHWNAGSNQNPNGPPGIAIDSALGLSIGPNGQDFTLVSNERNAFLLPDQDLSRPRNIIPHPNPANGRSNRDGHDNAFRGPAGNALDFQIKPCAVSNINYSQFIRGPAPVNGFFAGQRYINVWIDFNRDGDWADVNLGGACPEAPNATVDEWFAQNVPAPGVSGVFTLPQRFIPAYNDFRPLWVRISIADDPAPAAPNAGRGPAAGYRFGETEDHLLCFRPETAQWRMCGVPRMSVRERNGDNVRIEAQKPFTVGLDIEEDATFPVTVTLVISGNGDFREVQSSQLLAAATPLPKFAAAIPTPEPGRGLVIQRVVPNRGALGNFEIQLGWYGCITCTLAASARSGFAPQGALSGSAYPSNVSLMTFVQEADGVESADEIMLEVGRRLYVPIAVR
jgi:hypothetical protein